MDAAKFRVAEQVLWERTGLMPTEEIVGLPRLGVKVRVQAVGEGEPVLFIHGGPNSGSTWAPMLPSLLSAAGGGFRCLLVDRPGTGLSEPLAVRAENLEAVGAAFVGDVLTALEVEDAHVVASSFGGHLALRSAAAEPGRFRRMVQMACPALSQGERLPSFLKLISFAPTRLLLNVLPPNGRANRSIMRQLGHGKSLDTDRISEGFFDWYLALQRHTDTNRNDGAMIASVMRARPQLELSDELLARVAVPTHFLWGEDDTFGDAEVARHYVAQMPHASVSMVAEAGHLPWLDDPEGISSEVVAFLRGEEPSGDQFTAGSPAVVSEDR